MLIDATGSVAQVQQTFHVQINNYQLGNHTFYANAGPPSVPAPISQLITSIGGLDNGVHYQPLYRRLARQNHSHLAVPRGFVPKNLSGGYEPAALQIAGNLGGNQTKAR